MSVLIAECRKKYDGICLCLRQKYGVCVNKQILLAIIFFTTDSTDFLWSYTPPQYFRIENQRVKSSKALKTSEDLDPPLLLNYF